MKLISYLDGDRATFGAVTDDGVIDLAVALAERHGARYPDLKSILTDEGRAVAAAAVRAVGGAGADADAGAGGGPGHGASVAPRRRFEDLTLLPVIPNPGKIVCVGLNYGEHVRETNREVTEKPVLFLRVADSQVGHRQPMIVPAESTQFDYEGEIAVVIGRPGRRITETDAWSHIAGYACYNDGSVRDWQRHTQQWTPGKNFWRTGAFGPWLVTADEIAAGARMTLVTRLNGREMQRATTDMMIHGIARQIAYVSSFVPLATGDVIVTGTPGGVGARRDPPVFMKAGDTVEVEVDRIGTLVNPVAGE